MAGGRYCGHCGALADARARYCGTCGARLGTPALTAMGQETSADGVAPPLAPPHAPMPSVTGSVPMVPPGVAPAGGLSSTTVGRGRYVIDHLVGRRAMRAADVARHTHGSRRQAAAHGVGDQ